MYFVIIVSLPYGLYHINVVCSFSTLLSVKLQDLVWLASSTHTMNPQKLQVQLHISHESIRSLKKEEGILGRLRQYLLLKLAISIA